MLTRGAVLREVPGRFEVVELEVDDPRQGEIRVRMAAAGPVPLRRPHRHRRPAGRAPAPSRAGTRAPASSRRSGRTPRASRRATTSSSPSSRLRPLPLVRARACRTSATSAPSAGHGPAGRHLPAALDGTAGRADVRALHVLRVHPVSTSRRSRSTRDIPLEMACLVGCGVGTGWGSAVNAAHVRPGQVVIVMGIGGIGINAVQGAEHAGRRGIIAVDPVAFKRETALELGATDAVETMTRGHRPGAVADQRPGRRLRDRHRRRHHGDARRAGLRPDPQGRHRRARPRWRTSPPSDIPV